MSVQAARMYNNSQKQKQKVVVIGGGYAGRSFIKTIDTSKFDVVLIDKDLQKEKKSFLFNLVSFKALVFQPQPNYVDSIRERRIVNQYMYLPSSVKGIKDECIDVDTERKKVTLKSDEVLEYDHLVIATGSIPDTHHIQMEYNAVDSMWYFFKDRSDLEALLIAFKIIGLDNVVIMGGGNTGVELASELSKRILDAAGPNADAIKKTVTIVEPSSRLLPKQKEAASKKITQHLEQQKVEILTNAVIKGTSRGHLKIMQGDKELKVKAVVAVWTCGVKPDEFAIRCMGHNNVEDKLQLPPAVAPVPAATSDAAAATNATAASASINTANKTMCAATPLHTTGSNVFAIGDCNHLLPKSAQNAKQQGTFLANYFNSGFQETCGSFKFQSQGSMIRLSDRIYMDSPLYTGFLPLWVHTIIIGLDI